MEEVQRIFAWKNQFPDNIATPPTSIDSGEGEEPIPTSNNGSVIALRDEWVRESRVRHRVVVAAPASIEEQVSCSGMFIADYNVECDKPGTPRESDAVQRKVSYGDHTTS